MRNVTTATSAAFVANKPFAMGNTTVTVHNGVTSLILHGHTIATKQNGVVKVTNCGFFTNVTKERLNGIPGVMVQQRAGVWYLNGQEWDGELAQV